MLQGTVKTPETQPRPNEETVPVPRVRELEIFAQRGFRNLCTSDYQLPPVPPCWNSRIIIPALSHHCTLGACRQTTCLFTSKGSTSGEAIRLPDGEDEVLVFKPEPMLRCDLEGSWEGMNVSACQRDVVDGGVS